MGKRKRSRGSDKSSSSTGSDIVPAPISSRASSKTPASQPTEQKQTPKAGKVVVSPSGKNTTSISTSVLKKRKRDPRGPSPSSADPTPTKRRKVFHDAVHEIPDESVSVGSSRRNNSASSDHADKHDDHSTDVVADTSAMEWEDRIPTSAGSSEDSLRQTWRFLSENSDDEEPKRTACRCEVKKDAVPGEVGRFYSPLEGQRGEYYKDPHAWEILITKEYTKSMNIRPDMAVLEVGVGSGHQTAALVAETGEYGLVIGMVVEEKESCLNAKATTDRLVEKLPCFQAATDSVKKDVLKYIVGGSCMNEDYAEEAMKKVTHEGFKGFDIVTLGDLERYLDWDELEHTVCLFAPLLNSRGRLYFSTFAREEPVAAGLVHISNQNEEWLDDIVVSHYDRTAHSIVWEHLRNDIQQALIQASGKAGCKVRSIALNKDTFALIDSKRVNNIHEMINAEVDVSPEENDWKRFLKREEYVANVVQAAKGGPGMQWKVPAMLLWELTRDGEDATGKAGREVGRMP